MNYKTLMGYSKKKVIKEQSKPKKTVVDKIKKELNEWNDTSFKNLPKRWSKKGSGGLTEFEQQGGKDTIKEVGAAAEYKKYTKLIDKDMMNLAKSVNKLKEILMKNGNEQTAKELGSIFVTNVGKFRHFIKIKWIKILRKII